MKSKAFISRYRLNCSAPINTCIVLNERYGSLWAICGRVRFPEYGGRHNFIWLVLGGTDGQARWGISDYRRRGGVWGTIIFFKAREIQNCIFLTHSLAFIGIHSNSKIDETGLFEPILGGLYISCNGNVSTFGLPNFQRVPLFLSESVGPPLNFDPRSTIHMFAV
jgi:hypothetical protein